MSLNASNIHESEVDKFASTLENALDSEIWAKDAKFLSFFEVLPLQPQESFMALTEVLHNE